jgi:hypothetical protein
MDDGQNVTVEHEWLTITIYRISTCARLDLIIWLSIHVRKG